MLIIDEHCLIIKAQFPQVLQITAIEDLAQFILIFLIFLIKEGMIGGRYRCKQLYSCIICQKMECNDKQEIFDQGDLSSQKTSAVSVQSEYKDKYTEFFHLWENVFIMKDKQQLIEILSVNNIHYSPKIFNPFTFRIISSSRNFQICEVELSWGYFITKIKIINSLKESIFHHNILSEGCFGKIHQFFSKKNKSIIKCCSITSDSEINQKLKRMIFKQYFITKIAAALNIGPKIISQTGFDISVYQNCIQFSIEKCKKIINIDLQSLSHLCQNLQIFHLLKIIHFDIKPENIMWSPTLRRIVFIDFGMSQIIDCDIGYKYPTNFKGTPNFCTEEMLQIFSSSEKAYLDVYFNDLYSMKQSITLLSRGSSQLQLQTNQYQVENFSNNPKVDKIQSLAKQSQYEAIFIQQIKSSLYFQNKDLFNKLCQNFKQKDFKVIKKIMKFISQNYSTNISKEFYNKFAPTLIKSSYKFDWINSSSNSLYFKQHSKQYETNTMKSFFEKYYAKLVKKQDKQFDIFFITKKMAEDFLLSKEFKGGKGKLYKIFMSYISFTNNIYRCTVDEKFIAAKIFIDKIIGSKNPQQNSATAKVDQDSTSEDHLIQILIPLFRQILYHFITNAKQANNSYSLNQQSKLQLIFDILEHCFLFKIFERDELMKIINDLYDNITKSEEQKLQMILKIRNFNKWFLFSNKYTSQISFSVISKWTQKMEQILLKKDILGNKIFSYSNQIYKVTSQEEFSIFDCYENKNIVPSLLIELQIQQFFNKLSNMNPRTIHNLLKKLHNTIPYHLKSKIFSIHLHLFFTFNNKYKNIQQRDVIYHRFQQNIQSSVLMESSILKKCMKLSHQNRLKDQMNNFIGFLQFTNIRSIKYIAEPIQYTAKILYFNGFAKQADKQQKKSFFDNFSRILNNLKDIDKQKYDRQDCVFISETHSWFQMKNIFLVLKKQENYDLTNDIEYLQTHILQEENDLARFKMKSCLAWMKQQSLFVRRPRNYIENIMTIHEELKQYHNSLIEYRQNCKGIAYIMQNYYFLLKICDQLREFNSICQQAYFKLYQFTKNTNSYYFYIYLLKECPIIIYCTLHAIIYKKDMLEVAELIRMILISVHYVESFFHLGELIQSFYKFIMFQQRAGNSQLLFFLEEYFSKYQESQPYVIIYYYSCFQGLSDPKQKTKYLLKVLRKINRLPKVLIFSFTCFLYHSLLRELQLFLSIQWYNREISDELKLRKMERKKKFMRKQLIKSQIIQFQRKITRFQQKNANPFKKSLFRKCYKIKSFINGGKNMIMSIKPAIRLAKIHKQ